MWKPYVKWENNLILLRLAAHLVDRHKLTRGFAIYLIGHKIRVCISLSSMEPHSFVPPVPPVKNEGDAAGPSSSSTRLSGISPIQVGGKAALRLPQLQGSGCACPWQVRQRQGHHFWQDTLCRRLVTSQWRLLRIETVPSSHEEVHWFCWRSWCSSNAKGINK